MQKKLLTPNKTQPTVEDFTDRACLYVGEMKKHSGQRPTLYYVTKKFKELPKEDDNLPYSIYEPREVIKIVNAWSKDLFKHIINQVVPSNHRRNRRKDIPVVMSFIDFAGSRDHRIKTLIMPHTHALYIVPPQTVARFESLIDDGFRLFYGTDKTRFALCPHVKEVGYTRQDITRCIDYASKFFRSSFAQGIPEVDRSLIFDMYGPCKSINKSWQ